MPLENASVGSPGFGRNVATEMEAGKPQKQAVAIAYSKARGDSNSRGDSHIHKQANGELTGKEIEVADRVDAMTAKLDSVARRLDAWERNDAAGRLA